MYNKLKTWKKHVVILKGWIRNWREGGFTEISILPASSLRNLTTLQPDKINARRKSRALIGCCHIRKTPPAVHVIVRRYIPLVITMVTHALCLDTFWLVTCQVESKIWIQLHWEWLASRNNHRLKGHPFAKIVPNKLNYKSGFTQIFIRNLGL
jgi:hypothetical protein